MYEHPIKRAGLTFNRILLSNSRMVAPAFPGFGTDGKYRLQFKMKFYENGKETSRKYVSANNLDEVFPARKWWSIDEDDKNLQAFEEIADLTSTVTESFETTEFEEPNI